MGPLLVSTEVRLLDNMVPNLKDTMVANLKGNTEDLKASTAVVEEVEGMDLQGMEHLLPTRACPSTVVRREYRPPTVSDEVPFEGTEARHR
jgi:hypothetical protein